MANATAANTPETAAAPAPLKTVGRFIFALEQDVEIPKTAGRGRPTNALPFHEMFSGMVHKSHIFVPASFWSAPKEEGGREVPVEKVTHGYQRNKLMTAFGDWRKKDEAAREKFTLFLVNRNKGDDGGKYTEAGISMFLIEKDKT